MEGSGALAGLAAVVIIFATFGIGWLRLIREMHADMERRLEQKDKDLVDLRREKEELTIKVKALTATAAKLDNRTVEQGAILYGKLVYIRRLEKGYKDRNWLLPPRDGDDEE